MILPGCEVVSAMVSDGGIVAAVGVELRVAASAEVTAKSVKARKDFKNNRTHDPLESAYRRRQECG